jgi:hypothetical protein
VPRVQVGRRSSGRFAARCGVDLIMTLLGTWRDQSADAGWSASVGELLRKVVEDGFTFYLCGERPDLAALVAAYCWDSYVDLLTMIEPSRVTAARAIRHPYFDVFHPRSVVWAYGHEAVPTIHSLLHLVHPNHPDHATYEFVPPQWMRVPPEQQRPLTVRAPKPWHMGNRARRLEAAMKRDVAEKVAAGLLNETQGVH